jgi:hypothetical protein
MHFWGPANELQQYLFIFIFLAALILFSLWLAFQIYPKVLLYIDEKEISLSFTGNSFFKPEDFSVKINNIIYITPLKITGNDYVVFKTKNPSRKFQLSAPSYKSQEYEEFNIAMNEIREKVNAQNINL